MGVRKALVERVLVPLCFYVLGVCRGAWSRLLLPVVEARRRTDEVLLLLRLPIELALLLVVTRAQELISFVLSWCWLPSGRHRLEARLLFADQVRQKWIVDGF